VLKKINPTRASSNKIKPTKDKNLAIIALSPGMITGIVSYLGG
jgi:hypothetical protein